VREFKDTLNEFKKFLIRGNVVDLAVAVVIGAAFTSVVNALVSGLITPLIGALGGNHSFAGLKFVVNGSTFAYGDFINALISFVIVAAVVFFLVIQPVNHLVRLATRNQDKKEIEKKDPQVELLEEIRDLLKKR
jgi:large conductance mechanosensitive channel